MLYGLFFSIIKQRRDSLACDFSHGLFVLLYCNEEAAKHASGNLGLCFAPDIGFGFAGDVSSA
jgi:hypothetical protein